MNRLLTRLWLGLGAGGVAIGSAAAQNVPDLPIVLDGREEMDFDRPESWALKYFASVSMMRGFGTPQPTDSGAIGRNQGQFTH
jgi:hypothetical protein